MQQNDDTGTVLSGSRCFVKAIADRCRGCGLCELACSIDHEGEARPSVARMRVAKDRENYRFILSLCRQCEKPRCAAACPTGAIQVDGRTGAKVIHGNLCDNCGLCAKACPFNAEGNIIFPNPFKKVHVKCDLCFSREKGPACIEICPSQALVLKEISR